MKRGSLGRNVCWSIQFEPLTLLAHAQTHTDIGLGHAEHTAQQMTCWCECCRGDWKHEWPEPDVCTQQESVGHLWETGGEWAVVWTWFKPYGQKYKTRQCKVMFENVIFILWNKNWYLMLIKNARPTFSWAKAFSSWWDISFQAFFSISIYVE